MRIIALRNFKNLNFMIKKLVVLLSIWVFNYFIIYGECKEVIISERSILSEKYLLDLLNPYDGLILAPLLIPRTPGSNNSSKVREHIKNCILNNKDILNNECFSNLQWISNKISWNLFEDSFSEITSVPNFIGDEDDRMTTNFTNLVFTKSPPWILNNKNDKEIKELPRYLTIAAHYDSKFEPKGFIGAIDSAVPCSLIIYIGKIIGEKLSLRWEKISNKNISTLIDYGENMELYYCYPSDNIGLQLVFFDGEEAIREWTDEDSIYGARHLAELWSKKIIGKRNGKNYTMLDSIDLFVLLDLLGTSNDQIFNFFPSAQNAFNILSNAEKTLQKQFKQMRERKNQLQLNIFKDKKRKCLDHVGSGGYIADDHIPFLTRKVNVLHLISFPFPSIWHTLDDNADNVDFTTIREWALILTMFVKNYLRLHD